VCQQIPPAVRFDGICLASIAALQVQVSMPMVLVAVTVTTNFILFYYSGENSLDTICAKAEAQDWCIKDQGRGGLVVVSYTGVPSPGKYVLPCGFALASIAGNNA